MGVGGEFQKGIPCYGLDRGWEEEEGGGGGGASGHASGAKEEDGTEDWQAPGKDQEAAHHSVQCLTFHHACCLRPQTNTTTNPSQGMSLSVVPVTVSGNNFPLKTGLM